VIVTAGVTGLVVTEISLLAATGVVTQPALLVITTDTTSPSLSVLLVNVGLLVPTFVPLTFHWYVGLLPPFTGVAVKVIAEPSQREVEVAVIVTAGVTSSSLSVIVLLVTTGIVTHSALLVIVTDTTSPDLSVLLVNVGLLVPTLLPFTCHWNTGSVPPLIVVAVNTIVVFAHTDVELAVMLTSGSSAGLITTVTGFTIEQPSSVVALI
jgi:hypothetical protein